MAKKPTDRTTRPLIQSVLDFTIETTSDGLGLIITAPGGKEFNMTDSRAGFKWVDGKLDFKRLEVRVK